MMCPVPGCDRSRRPSQVMCRTHWFRVPKPLRDQIWFEYRSHRGSGAHLALILEAVVAVAEKESANGPV
jgi:hypothetical protein